VVDGEGETTKTMVYFIGGERTSKEEVLTG
jgi:hypothetical protein